jgi:nucleotide-binding universal stress UspA family protein
MTMRKLRKVIVPLDGSELSESAIAPARAIAARADVSLLFVTTRWDSNVSAARRYVDLQAALADAEADVVLDREAVDAICLEGRENRDALICMATHGRGGLRETVLGSVAEAVIRSIERPVVLVGPGNRLGQSLPTSPRVVVGLDGSDASKAILPAATDLALALGASIRLVQVVLEPEVINITGPRMTEAVALEDTAKELRDAGVDADYEIIDDHDVSAGLARYAADLPASIVAVATHGRTGLARVALGSVAIRIVRRSPCPVLVVRPDASA